MAGAPAHVSAFAEGVRAALEDARRIDELVCQFAYWGTLQQEHQGPAVGHGNIKRALIQILLGSAPASAGDTGLRAEFGEAVGVSAAGDESEAAPPPPPGAAPSQAWHIRLDLRGHTDATDAVNRRISLRLSFDKAGAVERLVVREEGGPSEAPLHPALAAAAAAAASAEAVDEEEGAVRPEWQTFDGRVTQRIWQSADLFTDPKNTLLRDTLELGTGRLVCIVDERVWDLYRDRFEGWCDREAIRLEPVVLAGNEDQKTVDNLLVLLDELARVDPLRRSEPVLAIGGGVLTDMAGFACALWRRGIPWCRMPTTLLGMVDASVGIKVAANYHRKNGIGAFHSPLHTFIDTSFLKSLALADVRSGVGEMMKAALVHDRKLFELLEEHGPHMIETRFAEGAAAEATIRRSVDAMLQCIGPDLWEESLVRPMDFGHSLSRTLEATESFKLRHGEAVAIDCAFCTLLSAEKGLVTREEAQRVLRVYADLGLPCSVAGITADTYRRAVREITVHRDGLLRAPLPLGIGACAYADHISDDEVGRAFEALEVFMEQEPHVKWDRSRSFDPVNAATEEEAEALATKAPSPQ